MSFFFKDGGDSATKLSSAGGRVEIVGNKLKCKPGEPCPVGVTHRLDLSNIEVPAGTGHDTIAQLTGVGESLPGREAGLSKDPSGVYKGGFGTGATIHSGRGRNTDEKVTTAFLAPNLEGIDVNLGKWDPRAVCTLKGLMVGPATGKVCSAGPPRSCNTTADCAAGGGGDCNKLDKYLTMFATSEACSSISRLPRTSVTIRQGIRASNATRRAARSSPSTDRRASTRTATSHPSAGTATAEPVRASEVCR